MQTAHRNICSVQRASPTLQLCTLLPAHAGLGTLSPQVQALALRALRAGVRTQAGRPGCRCSIAAAPGPGTLSSAADHNGCPHRPVGKRGPTPAVLLLQATDYKPTLPLLWHQCRSQSTVLPTCSYPSYQGTHSPTADPAPWHPPAGLRQFYAPSPVRFLSNNSASSFM